MSDDDQDNDDSVVERKTIVVIDSDDDDNISDDVDGKDEVQQENEEDDEVGDVLVDEEEGEEGEDEDEGNNVSGDREVNDDVAEEEGDEDVDVVVNAPTKKRKVVADQEKKKLSADEVARNSDEQRRSKYMKAAASIKESKNNLVAAVEHNIKLNQKLCRELKTLDIIKWFTRTCSTKTGLNRLADYHHHTSYHTLLYQWRRLSYITKSDPDPFFVMESAECKAWCRLIAMQWCMKKQWIALGYIESDFPCINPTPSVLRRTGRKIRGSTVTSVGTKQMTALLKKSKGAKWLSETKTPWTPLIDPSAIKYYDDVDNSDIIHTDNKTVSKKKTTLKVESKDDHDDDTVDDDVDDDDDDDDGNDNDNDSDDSGDDSDPETAKNELKKIKSIVSSLSGPRKKKNKKNDSGDDDDSDPETAKNELEERNSLISSLSAPRKKKKKKENKKKVISPIEVRKNYIRAGYTVTPPLFNGLAKLWYLCRWDKEHKAVKPPQVSTTLRAVAANPLGIFCSSRRAVCDPEYDPTKATVQMAFVLRFWAPIKDHTAKLHSILFDYVSRKCKSPSGLDNPREFSTTNWVADALATFRGDAAHDAIFTLATPFRKVFRTPLAIIGDFIGTFTYLNDWLDNTFIAKAMSMDMSIDVFSMLPRASTKKMPGSFKRCNAQHYVNDNIEKRIAKIQKQSWHKAFAHGVCCIRIGEPCGQRANKRSVKCSCHEMNKKKCLSCQSQKCAYDNNRCRCAPKIKRDIQSMCFACSRRDCPWGNIRHHNNRKPATIFAPMPPSKHTKESPKVLWSWMESHRMLDGDSKAGDDPIEWEYLPCPSCSAHKDWENEEKVLDNERKRKQALLVNVKKAATKKAAPLKTLVIKTVGEATTTKTTTTNTTMSSVDPKLLAKLKKRKLDRFLSTLPSTTETLKKVAAKPKKKASIVPAKTTAKTTTTTKTTKTTKTTATVPSKASTSNKTSTTKSSASNKKPRTAE